MPQTELEKLEHFVQNRRSRLSMTADQWKVYKPMYVAACHRLADIYDHEKHDAENRANFFGWAEGFTRGVSAVTSPFLVLAECIVPPPGGTALAVAHLASHIHGKVMENRPMDGWDLVWAAMVAIPFVGPAAGKLSSAINGARAGGELASGAAIGPKLREVYQILLEGMKNSPILKDSSLLGQHARAIYDFFSKPSTQTTMNIGRNVVLDSVPNAAKAHDLLTSRSGYGSGQAVRNGIPLARPLQFGPGSNSRINFLEHVTARRPRNDGRMAFPALEATIDQCRALVRRSAIANVIGNTSAKNKMNQNLIQLRTAIHSLRSPAGREFARAFNSLFLEFASNPRKPNPIALKPLENALREFSRHHPDEFKKLSRVIANSYAASENISGAYNLPKNLPNNQIMSAIPQLGG